MEQLAWILQQGSIPLVQLVISAGTVNMKLHLTGPNA